MSSTGPPPPPPSAGRPPLDPFRWTAHLLPPEISLFVLSLGVFSLNFGDVGSVGALQNARLEFSETSCETRRPHQTRPGDGRYQLWPTPSLARFRFQGREGVVASGRSRSRPVRIGLVRVGVRVGVG